MSDLVGNHKDRFSLNEAQIIIFVSDLKACNIEADPTDIDYDDVGEENDDLLGLRTLHIDTTLTVHNMSPGREKSSRKRATKVGSKKLGSLDKRSGRNKFWTLKFKGKLQVRSSSDIKRVTGKEDSTCVCMSYKRSNSESDQDAGEKDQRNSLVSTSNLSTRPQRGRHETASLPVVNLDELYPVNDIDEERIQQRRREMERGIEIENVWVHRNSDNGALSDSTNPIPSCSNSSGGAIGQYPSFGAMGLLSDQPCLGVPSSIGCSTSSLACPWVLQNSDSHPQQIHTQVDFIHYLVPDLDKIVSSSFYWGIMDRYQAEKVIENKPEGTFLLRDSAQEEFLFSVSFRRYGRSLHARIEQWNHNFSFDSRDPGVYATKSVCGLIDHYKDPSCCMFFEPMLTLPLHRNFPFSLQHLARAKICCKTTYDGISQLSLPRALKEYLRAYHYKQKVRVKRFDNAA